MPEVGSLAERSPTVDASGSEVVGETLIFSSDAIKSDNFNQGDHVILVVPESSEHLVGEEHLVSGETSYVIPSETVGDDQLSPARLRETIKSNFLVIAKLLPSKSPPPLVPISGNVSDEPFQAEPFEAGCVIERLPDSNRSDLKQTSKPPRPTRTPRQPTAKSHPSVKQEGPEIFGKMFPASFNDVLFKQIREIVQFKCGKGSTDDTEVASGIKCPHCRKKPSTLNQLKEHLTNCHTYAPAKRKPVDKSSKSIKKMLFRCQYCDEAFISQSHREVHECSLTAKSLEHLSEADALTTCSICSQDFGSRSELLSHQELDHKTVERARTPAKYIACPICEKRVLVSLRDEHIKRHELSSLIEEIPAEPPKCAKCSQPLVNGVCSCSTDAHKATICPLCDIEVLAADFDKHISGHNNRARQASGSTTQIVCKSCDNDYKVYNYTDREGLCRKCRNPS